MERKYYKKIAFTLIELLVVIAVIGILSGLIVVSMNGVTDKARIAKSKIFSNSLRNSLMNNLVSECKFDGPTSSNGAATANDVLDTWKNINNGVIVNAPTVKTESDCVSGSCLSFNGSSNYVDLGSNSDTSLSLSIATISLWIKPINRLNNQELISKHLSDNSASVKLQFNGNNNLQMYTLSGGNDNAPSILITDSNWHQIVIVLGDNGVKGYLDGIEKYNRPELLRGLDIAPASNVWLGARPGGVAGTFYNGLMDEVRIYDTSIPTSQIKEQYYAGLNSLFLNGVITEKDYLSRIKQTALNE